MITIKGLYYYDNFLTLTINQKLETEIYNLFFELLFFDLFQEIIRDVLDEKLK